MDDTISRRDAIEALKICDNNEFGTNCHKCPLRDKRWDGAWENDETICYRKLMRDSAELLSAEPEKILIARINLSEEQVREAVERAKNEIVQMLPSAQQEQTSEIQDILNYLDTVLHPIVSPEHWDVYSELHDMISTLPSPGPRPRGRWIDHTDDGYVECPFCGSATNCDDNISELHYCFSCGADMREEEAEQ